MLLKHALFEIYRGDFMKIGIDLGGSHIAVGIISDEGRILAK